MKNQLKSIQNLLILNSSKTLKSSCNKKGPEGPSCYTENLPSILKESCAELHFLN